MKVLDWDKLRIFVDERKPVEVSAGLLDDWFWTAATAYENGEYLVDHNAFTSSDHATPGFKATLENGDVIEVVATRLATAEDLELIKKNFDDAQRVLSEWKDSLD